MRQHHLAKSAEADFEAIIARITTDDPTTAQAVAKRIRVSIETVCLFPGTGKRTDVPDVWVFSGTKHQPFRFTYQVHETHIVVLRIFRHSRNTLLTA